MAEPIVQVPVALPTREQIAEALYLDDADHEDWSWQTEDNPSTRAAYLKNADAVLALFQQPTPTAEPPRIDDMAPGTRFSAATPDGSGHWRWTLLSDGRVRLDGTTEIWYPNSIDPSTIRDVTPPTEGTK